MANSIGKDRRALITKTKQLPLFPEQAGLFNLGYLEPVDTFTIPIAAIRIDSGRP